MRRIRLAFALPLVLAACNNCPGSNTGEDAGSSGSSGNLNHADSGHPTDAGGSSSSGGGDSGTPDNKVITFNGTAPVVVFYGDGVDLAFTLRNNGTAVPDALMQFGLSGNGATLSVTAAHTNTQGVTGTRLVAGSADADLVVTATSAGATPGTVAIRVRAQPAGNINVNVTAQTRIPVARAEVFLYHGAGGAFPTCAALTAAVTPPTTTNTGTITPVPGARSFTGLPSNDGLSVLARGYTAAGDKVAEGCTDNGAVVVGGITSTVTVTMNQLPSVLAGDYDVLMSMNVGAALPAPYDTYVDSVTNLLAYPAENLAYYIMLKVDESAGSTTMNYVPATTPARKATFAEVMANQTGYGTWNLARNAIQGWATSSSNPAQGIYTTVTTAGADLRAAVTQFEIGSRFHVVGVPGSDNTVQITETWQAMVYTWQLSCTPGDLGCARRPILLANTNYSPVSVTYNATYVREPTTGTNPLTERYKVVTDAHPMPFSYGNAVLIAIDEILIATVAPNCTAPTGGSCHGLGDLLGYMVDCPNAPWGNSVLNGVVTPALCQTGVTMLAGFVEQKAKSLVIGAPSGDPKDAKGLNGSGTFYLVDKNLDLKTELFTEYTAIVQWRDPTNPSFTQDVTAPITGHGREAATNCAFDGSCTTAGMSCQPEPHYLEVKQVELTCAKNVGATAGGASCTANNQCGSGICVGFSIGSPGTCFRACQNSPQCGGSGAVCQAARTSVNLNTVRSGLGSAPVQGCNP